MKINSLSSFTSYLSFACAKEFRYKEAVEEKILTSTTEKIANVFFRPFELPVDYVLKNVNKPAIIPIINVVGVIGITMIFFPDEGFNALQAACSPIFDLEPWMPKFATFVFSGTVINSFGIRTIARCRNVNLLANWEEKKNFPIYLGSTQVSIASS